jgi:hypothetical protein
LWKPFVVSQEFAQLGHTHNKWLSRDSPGHSSLFIFIFLLNKEIYTKACFLWLLHSL